MDRFEKCQKGLDCLQHSRLGRPAFLVDSGARASGMCKPCRDDELGLPPSDLDFEPVISKSLVLEQAPRQAAKSQEVVEISADKDADADADTGTFAGEENEKDSFDHGLALKVEIDGREVTYQGYYESLTREQFERGIRRGLANASKTIEKWESLENDQIDFNEDLKEDFITKMQPEEKEYFSLVVSDVMPSKSGPEPLKIISRDLTDEASLAAKSNLVFSTVYQAANFMVNDDRFAWIRRPFQPHAFRFEMMRGSASEGQIPHLDKDAVTTQDYNCAVLISKDECRKIFGDKTPDQLALDMARLARLWTDSPKDALSDPEDIDSMIGNESLPDLLKSSGAAYAAAIGVGVSASRMYSDFERSPASPLGKNFVSFIEEAVVPGKKFASEKDALSYLKSNPEELDDFLYNPSALNWLLKRRLETMKASEMPDEGTITKIRESQRQVVQFTNLIDKKWSEKFERDGIEALRQRFGHPVGIPTDKVRAYHFLPGGYLVESGFVSVSSGDNFSLEAKLPIDKNGKPSSTISDWEKVSPALVIDQSKSKTRQLGDLAEGCATGIELWHTMYNKGLPRDSLYSGAQLSVIDPSINAVSQDDYSGTVRGLYHPKLRGVELAVGARMHCFPTTTSKISAIAERLADKDLCPRGHLALRELELSNWRLARLRDNFSGNEYGLAVPNEKETIPHSFDKMGREFHEKIQSKIKAQGPRHGVLAYCQPEESFVRPLVGRQRGEALRMFIERPGTYLRRTGLGGDYMGEGSPRAVYEQIKAPLAPWSVFIDPATGEPTDCSVAATPPPGTQSLNPYTLVCDGASALVYDENTAIPVELMPKQMTVSSGRRGENMPRRLRFAAISMGEKAAKSGLVKPFGSGDQKFYEVPNVYQFVEQKAVVTGDAPSYAPELTRAPWHQESLFMRDYELGEMGDAHRSFSSNDRERKALLQSFLHGKHSEREKFLEDSRKSLAVLQMSYAIPADSRTAFGDLSLTGQTWIVGGGGDSANRRKHGLIRGSSVATRAVGTFASIPVPDDHKRPSGIRTYREGDEMSPNVDFLPASRPGYGPTGLEDTPLRFDGRAPSQSLDYQRKWADAVVAKGLTLEYEPAEFSGQGERGRTMFRRFYESVMQKVPAELKGHEHLLMAAGLFSSVGGSKGADESLSIQVQEIYDDERVMRAAQDSEGALRKDVDKMGRERRNGELVNEAYERYLERLLGLFRLRR